TCFFFSSRRRHTRFSRDWSSDVCSSDLDVFFRLSYEEYYRRKHRSGQEKTPGHPLLEETRAPGAAAGSTGLKRRIPPQPEEDIQIGRASCRERVQIPGVAV